MVWLALYVQQMGTKADEMWNIWKNMFTVRKRTFSVFDLVEGFITVPPNEAVLLYVRVVVG